MHMIFTDKEMEWIDKKKFGWPIKNGCPSDVRKSIENKKKIIDSQMKNERGSKE